jgi:hypothetical protein
VFVKRFPTIILRSVTNITTHTIAIIVTICRVEIHGCADIVSVSSK